MMIIFLLQNQQKIGGAKTDLQLSASAKGGQLY